MLGILLSGGVLVIPLGICFIVAVAIIIERLLILNQRSILPTERIDYLCETVSEYNAGEKLRSTYDGNPLQRVLMCALHHEKEGKSGMRQAISHEIELIGHDFERFLNMLGTITMISPLLGLLGTVLGMIQVFETILEQSTGIAPSLAGGISQALVTTAMGMAIAIPSVFFHRMFHRRIDSLLVELEAQTVNILEQYRQQD